MTHNNINEILERYWEGETNQQEEILLKEYFKRTDIAAIHEPFRSLFAYYEQQTSIKYNGNQEIDFNILLNKYWDGETSVNEDEALKKHFKSNTVSNEHLVYKDFFTFLDQQGSVTYIEKPSVPSTTIVHFNFKKIWYAAAAVTVLVLGSVTVMNNLKTKETAAQTAMIQEIDDPEEALRVTKEALALVSRKFRKSQESVKQNMGALEKASIFK